VPAERGTLIIHDGARTEGSQEGELFGEQYEVARCDFFLFLSCGTCSRRRRPSILFRGGGGWGFRRRGNNAVSGRLFRAHWGSEGTPDWMIPDAEEADAGDIRTGQFSMFSQNRRCGAEPGYAGHAPCGKGAAAGGLSFSILGRGRPCGCGVNRPAPGTTTGISRSCVIFFLARFGLPRVLVVLRPARHS